MEGGKVLKKKSNKWTREMKVNINGNAKGLAEQELGRRIKMLDLEACFSQYGADSPREAIRCQERGGEYWWRVGGGMVEHNEGRKR